MATASRTTPLRAASDLRRHQRSPGANNVNGADQTCEANRQFNRRVTITFHHPAGTARRRWRVGNPAPAAPAPAGHDPRIAAARSSPGARLQRDPSSKQPAAPASIRARTRTREWRRPARRSAVPTRADPRAMGGLRWYPRRAGLDRRRGDEFRSALPSRSGTSARLDRM
jgi:hypothetical protein